MLYIFGGLPGTGKTTLSKSLAKSINATHIRIDTIEQTLRNNGMETVYDEGYQIAFSVALDNLRNGVSVVADSTNPVAESRAGWISVAAQAEAFYKEIEVICSDTIEHRSRVETRQSDIANLVLPHWESVVSREYQPWSSCHTIVDTAGKTVEQSEQELLRVLGVLTSK